MRTYNYSEEDKGNKSYICNFCHKKFCGGRTSKTKKHLADVIGDITPCTKISPEVRFTMQSILKETTQREKHKTSGGDINNMTIMYDDEEMEETQN